MKLDKYWPDSIKRLNLMRSLAELETEALDRARLSLEKLEADLYIESATDEGLARYEKALGLLVPEGASLEDRRMAILASINTKIPYTKRGLKALLDNLVGKEGHVLLIDYANRKIAIKLDLSRKHQMQAVKEMLRRVVPANMEISVTLRYNQVYMLKRFSVQELKAYTVEGLRTNPEIKRKFIERGGELIE